MIDCLIVADIWTRCLQEAGHVYLEVDQKQPQSTDHSAPGCHLIIHSLREGAPK